jgi:serine/threonine-protein kinase RsbW
VDETPADPEIDDGARAGATVDLRIPAEVAYVPVLRTLTAGLAARCELTIDQVEDLRIAVDEACALLLPHATPAAHLDAHFILGPMRIDVRVEVAAAPTADPDRDGFAWTVLRALADNVEVTSSDGALAIKLNKRREAAAS